MNFKARKSIDWTARKSELLRILDTHKNSSGYDCIVPSSGGKDSHYQVLTLLELGAKPLVVTATTCMLTDIGRKNIDNLSRYATTIEYTPNREQRRKLNRLGLELVGDVSWPEHASIFSVPFRMAKSLGISLIFYGENPQREYGSPLGAEQAATMTRRWVSEFGGLLGLRPSDLVEQAGAMTDYELPQDMSGIDAYFLGQFIEWDSHRNAEVASMAGMKWAMPSEHSWWVFENLDCVLTGLHDHGMFLKYGYGRACAQLSVDIRNGRLTREAGLKFCKNHDHAFPEKYMGVPFEAVLDHLGMTREQVMAALGKFTNQDVAKAA